MIKLKSLISENTVRFEKDDTVMMINTPKGDFKVRVFKFERNGVTKYNYDIISPPDYYRDFEVNGKMHKMAVGGSVYLGNASTNLEQVYAALSEQLKKMGFPYVQALKLKMKDSDNPENTAFLEKLGNVLKDFQKEMQKPENQPKQFGAGPPEFGQWVSGDDVKNGRLKWVIENYGDFYVVIKWAMSSRQQIKASEFLKHYDHIISGKQAAGDYAREVYIRKEPFDGI